MGPEPTQIGAMPLIGFGDEPLVSTIGKDSSVAPEKPAPPRKLPAASGIALPEVMKPTNRRLIPLLILLALAIGAAVVFVVLRRSS